MRKYLFGTGIIGAVTSGISLLRGSRDASFTWRTGLAWLSWGITLALAIGEIIDARRVSRGYTDLAEQPDGEAGKILKRMR